MIHIAVKYYRSVLKEAEQVRRAMEKEKVRGVSEEVEKNQNRHKTKRGKHSKHKTKRNKHESYHKQ